MPLLGLTALGRAVVDSQLVDDGARVALAVKVRAHRKPLRRRPELDVLRRPERALGAVHE